MKRCEKFEGLLSISKIRKAMIDSYSDSIKIMSAITFDAKNINVSACLQFSLIAEYERDLKQHFKVSRFFDENESKIGIAIEGFKDLNFLEILNEIEKNPKNKRKM